jgi:hypothetical protein
MCLFCISHQSREHEPAWTEAKRATSTHHPLAILTRAHAAAGLVELEVLQQLHAVRILGVLLQAPLPFPRQPFRQRPGSGCAGDRVHRHGGRVSELHAGGEGNRLVCRTRWELFRMRSRTSIWGSARRCERGADFTVHGPFPRVLHSAVVEGFPTRAIGEASDLTERRVELAYLSSTQAAHASSVIASRPPLARLSPARLRRPPSTTPIVHASSLWRAHVLTTHSTQPQRATLLPPKRPMTRKRRRRDSVLEHGLLQELQDQCAGLQQDR